MTHIVGIALAPQITRTDIEQCALVTTHQLFVGTRDVKKLAMRARHELLIREFAGVIAQGQR
ncbi:hypothetical protein D9M69_715240 [compost metagenome]